MKITFDDLGESIRQKGRFVKDNIEIVRLKLCYLLNKEGKFKVICL
jgi:hypothetical protein